MNSFSVGDVFSALDSIVDSINETVRKYCVSESTTSPTRETDTNPDSVISRSISSPASTQKPPPDASLLPRISASVGDGVLPPSSACQTNGDNSVEVSFASVARGLFAPPSIGHRPLMFTRQPTTTAEVSTQTEFTAQAEVAIQAGETELASAETSGRCCPFCHNQLPVTDDVLMKAAEFHKEGSGSHISTGPSDSLPTSSSSSTVLSPGNLPSFVQCTLSLGDSFHYSPLRSVALNTSAAVRILPSSSGDGLGSAETATAGVAPSVDVGFVSADGSAPHPGGFPNTQPSSVESPVEQQVVTFSVTPEALRTPADSAGQLSNTSLSNITLSDLLPSMQGSIPLELIVNQTDGFTMYTEIVPVSEADPASLPASGSSCAGTRVSEVAVSDGSWSSSRVASQPSPVNVMVCLPLSSVSSPSLSSFLSQHRSLTSFTTMSRPPTPADVQPPTDNVETVGVAMVTSFDEEALPLKPVENFSIHRILDTSALKHVAGRGFADCSWSSSNTGVLISRRDVATNSAGAMSDSSVADDDRPPDIGCHDDGGFHGDDSCHGDDSDTHDDICVIDSDRDVIVIDGDDEVTRPVVVGSDPSGAAVPERTCRVGRHGRRRRPQTNKCSANTDRMSSRLTTEVDASDRSLSVNCLDNGFVETSPSANVERNSPLRENQPVSPLSLLDFFSAHTVSFSVNTFLEVLG